MTPTSDALREGLRQPLIELVEEVVEHKPHPDIRVATAKVIAAYQAGPH